MSRSSKGTGIETMKVGANGEPLMSLEMYLQKHPQKKTIANLMRSKYKGQIKTETEWNEALDALLGKKVVS